uniref:Uncharacterized protein n=1 Tax=Ditylenchus dipsaci TaxID=166011 RepID=A0A915EFL4_9BILA
MLLENVMMWLYQKQNVPLQVDSESCSGLFNATRTNTLRLNNKMESWVWTSRLREFVARLCDLKSKHVKY